MTFPDTIPAWMTTYRAADGQVVPFEGTAEQVAGRACVTCGATAARLALAGTGPQGQVFACVPCSAVPAVVCTPWCQQGDGHPEDHFVEDQTCYSPERDVPVRGDADALGWTPYVSAYATRRAGRPDEVELHLAVDDVDRAAGLTPGAARDLARYLVEAAELVEAATGLRVRA
jgi:hypothetical protein